MYSTKSITRNILNATNMVETFLQHLMRNLNDGKGNKWIQLI